MWRDKPFKGGKMIKMKGSRNMYKGLMDKDNVGGGFECGR